MVGRCEPGAYPAGLASWLRKYAPAADAAILLTGAMENHLRVVSTVTRGRPSWTPCAGAMRRARDPHVFQRLVLPRGVAPCAVSLLPPRGAGPGTCRFLRKPLRGAAGCGIQWHPAAEGGPPCYYQAYVEGTSLSAVYAAWGEDAARCLGVTRQLIGDPHFGAGAFRYCGNIGPQAVTVAQAHAFTALGKTLAAACGLQGIFGIDVVIDHTGTIRPVEINPRYPAGVEVLERAGLHPVLATGAAGGGDTMMAQTPPGSGVQGRVAGKAIVYARHDAITPDLYACCDSAEVADVPDVGTLLRRGAPVCTVLAAAVDDPACEATLCAMAKQVHDALAVRSVRL